MQRSKLYQSFILVLHFSFHCIVSVQLSISWPIHPHPLESISLRSNHLTCLALFCPSERWKDGQTKQIDKRSSGDEERPQTCGHSPHGSLSEGRACLYREQAQPMKPTSDPKWCLLLGQEAPDKGWTMTHFGLRSTEKIKLERCCFSVADILDYSMGTECLRSVTQDWMNIGATLNDCMNSLWFGPYNKNRCHLMKPEVISNWSQHPQNPHERGTFLITREWEGIVSFMGLFMKSSHHQK